MTTTPVPASEPLVGPIGQIHVPVADLGRAVAFYRDTLGLSLLFEVPGQQMAFLDCHGIRLYLGHPESGEPSRPILYFRVPRIGEAHQALLARGVAFAGPPHLIHRAGATELWMAFFHDSEGNLMALMAEQPAA